MFLDHHRGMYRLGIFVLCMTLLCGCAAKKEVQAAETVRDFYAGLSACTLKAEVTADFGESTNDFELVYRFVRDGESVVEVTAPAEIAGIEAVVNGEDSSLRYDGIALETGPLPGTALTPMDALPTMLRTWGEGYMTAVGKQKLDGVSCHQLTYESTVGDVSIVQNVWFDEQTYKPIQAETLANGVRVISCTFILTDFT